MGPSHLPYYGDAIIEYAGEGIIVLADNTELKCKFNAGQFINGNIVLICIILPIDIHRIDMQIWKEGLARADYLKGQTQDGKTLEATKLGYAISRAVSDDQAFVCAIFNPSSVIIDMQKDVAPNGIAFGITNFGFKGFQFNHPQYIEYLELDILEKKLDIWKVRHYDDIINRMRLVREARITSEIWTELSGMEEVEKMEKIITDLCYVLSVASGSKVQWIYRDVFSGEERISTLHKLVPNKPYNSWTIMGTEMDPIILAEFIKIAFPRFLSSLDFFGEVNDVPRIKAAIDALMDARIETDFLQIKGIKLVTTMEIVKEMFRVWMPKKKFLTNSELKKFGEEIKKALEPIFAGYFPDLPEEERTDAIGELKELNRPSFRYILSNGFEKIEFQAKKRDVDLLLKSRNNLVHQGRFYCETATEDQARECEPLKDAEEEYAFISQFLSDVFLSLLGYKCAWNNAGNTYFYMGRFEEAINAYNEAIRLDSNNAGPWIGLGNTYRCMGKDFDAIGAFRKAIELNEKPKNKLIFIVAFCALGSLLLINGNHPEAIEAIKSAIEIDPNYCPAHISLAACFKKFGEPNNLDKEMNIISNLISNEPEYTHACYEAVLGNTDEAFRQLRAALEKGQEPIEWILRDPDLDFIKLDQRFEKLIREFSCDR